MEKLYNTIKILYNFPNRERKVKGMEEMNEKEYEGMLFDQLTLIERIRKVAEKQPSNEEVLKTLDQEEKYIKRKLQKPNVE